MHSEVLQGLKKGLVTWDSAGLGQDLKDKHASLKSGVLVRLQWVASLISLTCAVGLKPQPRTLPGAEERVVRREGKHL